MVVLSYISEIYFDTDTEISDMVPVLIFRSIYRFIACPTPIQTASLSSPTASLTRILSYRVTALLSYAVTESESECPHWIAGIPHNFTHFHASVVSALF